MNYKKMLKFFLILCSLALAAGCASNNKSKQFVEPPNAKNVFEEAGGFQSVQGFQMSMSASKLKTIDLDQMNNKIMQYISSYRQSQDSSHLYRALAMTFSRPDEDSVREKVLSMLRNPIDENNEWSVFLTRLSMEAINTLNSSSASGEEQMTAGIVLENILEEMMPDHRLQKSTGGFESNLIYSIAITPMKYSQKALQERKLALMRLQSTPNMIAREILSR